MNYKCIYLSGDVLQIVLWKDEDIDSIKIFQKAIVQTDDRERIKSIEEFIYENPDIIRNQGETIVILDTPKAGIIPRADEEEIQKTLDLAWNISSGSTHEMIINVLAIENALCSAFLLEKELQLFLERSFYPLKVVWVMEPFINKWNNILKAKGNAEAKLYKVFIERDKNNFYLGVYGNHCLEYANIITSSREEMARFFITTVVETVCKDTDRESIITYTNFDKHDGDAEGKMSRIDYGSLKMTSKSSFVEYILDTREICLPIKTEIFNR